MLLDYDLSAYCPGGAGARYSLARESAGETIQMASARGRGSRELGRQPGGRVHVEPGVPGGCLDKERDSLLPFGVRTSCSDALSRLTLFVLGRLQWPRRHPQLMREYHPGSTLRAALMSPAAQRLAQELVLLYPDPALRLPAAELMLLKARSL